MRSHRNPKWLSGSCSLLAAFAAGCSLRGPDQGAIEIRTDSDTYVFSEVSNEADHYKAITVEYEVYNGTDEPISLPRCVQGELSNAVPQPDLMKLQNEQWIHALRSVCIMVLVEPVTVAPMESYRGVGTLWAHLKYNTYPRFEDELNDITGTYRIRLRVYEEFHVLSDASPVTKGTYTSNEFQVFDSQ